MSWNKFVRNVNKANRIMKDVQTLASGDVNKIKRRAKNKVKYKMLWRLFRKI